MSKPLNATEQRLPGLEGFDAWDDARILNTLLAGQRRALDAVERAIPALSRAATAIAPRLAAGGKLIYRGRVDNSVKPAEVTDRDLQNALEAVLQERPVPVASTKAFGCSVKYRR